MKHKDLTEHQKALIKEVAEALSLKIFKKKLEDLSSSKSQSVYMIAVQKFLNEDIKEQQKGGLNSS